MAKSNYQAAKKPKKIYLDYAASISPNPSSIHGEGVALKEKLEHARKAVADILHAPPSEIIFTSGGTEGNNLAIQGIIHRTPFLPHIITTNIEHPSVLETCRMLEKRGLAEISIVPVEASGIIDPKKIKKAIKKNTVLVSVMYANNEIGTIQPIKEIAGEIRHYKKGKSRVPEAWERDGADTRNFSVEKYPYSGTRLFPYFHTDAVQAANYLDLNIEKLGVDMLTLSGSKIPDAGRVGVLYRKKSVPLAPLWGGGDQEQGLRPGTENAPEILKFATALTAAQNIKDKEGKRLTMLRDYFFSQLLLEKAKLLINGDLKSRLPNNVNITFPKIPSDLLVIELGAHGIMASSKSACKSSRAEGSYVIEALRPNSNTEIGGVRFSLGRDTTQKDIDCTAKTLSRILQKLKRWYD